MLDNEEICQKLNRPPEVRPKNLTIGGRFSYELMRSLAQKHKVGFFDVSGDDGDIILPDGIMIK